MCRPERGGWPRRGEVPGLTLLLPSPPPPPGKSSVPRRRANTSSLPPLYPVNSAPSSEVRPRPCPIGPHLAPPPSLNPFLHFLIPYTGQVSLSGGCTWGWKNPANVRGFGAERVERARLGKVNHFWVVAKASRQVGASISLSPFFPSPGSSQPLVPHSDLDHLKAPWSNPFVPVASTPGSTLPKTMSTLGVSTASPSLIQELATYPFWGPPSPGFPLISP